MDENKSKRYFWMYKKSRPDKQDMGDNQNSDLEKTISKFKQPPAAIPEPNYSQRQESVDKVADGLSGKIYNNQQSNTPSSQSSQLPTPPTTMMEDLKNAVKRILKNYDPNHPYSPKNSFEGAVVGGFLAERYGKGLLQKALILGAGIGTAVLVKKTFYDSQNKPEKEP